MVVITAGVGWTLAVLLVVFVFGAALEVRFGVTDPDRAFSVQAVMYMATRAVVYVPGLLGCFAAAALRVVRRSGGHRPR
jgi:hypothetical protein